MNENLEKIELFCNQINYTGNTKKEYLFTVSCVDYFYYNKNMGADNVKDGLVDGANDGGIDFIYSDNEKLYLIQGKTSQTINYNDIRDIYNKMIETYNNLINKKYHNYSERLKTIFINNFDSFTTEPDVTFVLFTSSAVNENDVNKYNEFIKKDENLQYNFNLYTKIDIESIVLNIDRGEMLIEEGFLDLDEAKNHLLYKEGQGGIFTIRANSLKELYIRYRDSGLFGYNLREHISEKKVDGAIEETIKKFPENFWFLNNGITIACSDYMADGYRLKLYNFSIINGAQTTTKIGKSKLINREYDFSIVCKIVKSEESLHDDFIRKISEASNSQKPIKPRDLRANSREQQMLQQRAADNSKYSLSIDIKRGVKPPNHRKINFPWQRINNENLGQLLMSCFYQQPGAARSQKSDIFGKDKTYNLLFSYNKIIEYDYDSIYDIVRIAKKYDDFKIDYSNTIEKKVNDESNENLKKELKEKNNVCQNGKFIILSLLFYFYKRHYLKISQGDDKIYNEYIKGRLSLDYQEEDYDEKLNYFFEIAVERLLYIYNKHIVSLNLTSHSNFFKTNSNYNDVILPEFEKMYKEKFDQEKILYSISIFDSSKN